MDTIKKPFCPICGKKITRSGMITHVVFKHDWKPSDAKKAFKGLKEKE